MARGVPADVLDRLGKVPLFSACSRQELRRIASLGTEVRVGPGTELTRQGEPGSEFFLIRSGGARCIRNGRTVEGFGPGDFFGELALLTKHPRNATVVTDADADTVVRVFDRREFSSLLDDAPAIARKVLAALAERQTPNNHS
jgi:CRP-like cAMP-binding protein